MTHPLYLVLDQGGSASRALVFDATGEAFASARIEVGDSRPRSGWVEQDPDAVVASLRDVAAAAVAQLDEEQRARLQACGLECQRSSLVAWDRHTGAALSPILSWQDTRAAAWLAAQRLDVEAIRATTGLYPNAHFGVSKLRWCLGHLDAVKQSAHEGRLAIGPLAAFLAHRLLAQRPVQVDPANASRTLLLDLARGDWSDALLARFGIERAWLPTVVRSDAEFGELELPGETLRGSRRSHKLPLRLLSGDQSTAAFAYGEPQPEAAYLNVGTGAFAYRVGDAAPAGSRLLRSVVHWSEAPRFVVEGTVNGAGSALAWFAQGNGIDDVGAALEAAWTEAGAGDCVFVNAIGGLGSPDWRSDLESRFVGDGDRLVAVAESIVFLIHRNLERLGQVGAPCEYVLASGGLSRSDRFCRALANLSGLLVRRPGQCEASARGAAFLLAGCPSHWSALPEERFVPARDDGLQQRHQRWQGAMEEALGQAR